MSTTFNLATRPGIRLETWQGIPASTEPTFMSDREENWQVIMMRCDSADALEFEVRFLRLGSEVMIWPVPAPAKQDLANVFVQGGSFLRSTMNHMAAEWSKVQLSHPHLYSIYEQECLGITAMPAGAPSTGPKWHRLTL